MNTIRHVVIAFAVVGNVAAFAQEGTRDFLNPPVSNRTRAEVKAELAAARAQGHLDNHGESYGGLDMRKVESTRPRAEVLAELDAARRSGELGQRNYSYGPFSRTKITSSRSRAEVKAELAQALASGNRLSQGERSGG